MSATRRDRSAAGHADLCIGCLFSVSSMTGGFIVTACCHRTLCNLCTTRLAACPVCRIPVVQGGAVTQTNHSVIPAALPSQGDDLPSYDTDSENHAGRHSGGEHTATAEEPVPSYDFQNATAFLDIAELKSTEDGICAIHYVSSRDTLVGIGMKYNVPIDAIRKANKMFSSNIHEREKLIIPGVKQLPKSVSDPSDEMKEEREKTRRTKRFQLTTKCAGEEEARFYLEECEFDVDAAIARYQADLEWEARNLPPPHFGSSSRRTRTASSPAATSSSSSSTKLFPENSRSGSFSSSSIPMTQVVHPVGGRPKRLLGLF